MNRNAIFAALLKKYLAAKKLNNTALVQNFINDHSDDSVLEGDIPQEATGEIQEFASKFVSKKYKCEDSKFIDRMLEISNSPVEEFIPEQTVHYTGEY